jgi:hypothetical protein
LKLAGATYTPLVAAAEHDFMAIFQYSNSDIITEGNQTILAERISVEWERLIDSPSLALRDVLTFHNYEFDQEITFPVSLTLRAEFEDIFVVRGMLPPQLGELQEPIWRDDVLSFVYHGADGRYRSLSAHFSPAVSNRHRRDHRLVPDHAATAGEQAVQDYARGRGVGRSRAGPTETVAPAQSEAVQSVAAPAIE